MRATLLKSISICLALLSSKDQSIAQDSSTKGLIDPTLAKKLTVAGFCLCKTTVADLKNLDDQLQEVKVEEMSLCKDGLVQDARFVNGTGYYSKKISWNDISKKGE